VEGRIFSIASGACVGITMKWTNYHTHSHYCDGEGTLASYVRKAIEKNMYAIGFSSHAPVPFDSDWHMPLDHLEKYISEIEILKDEYKEIKIFSGLEVDYIPGETGPHNYADRNLDLIVGSVHYAGQFKDQDHCCIDDTAEEFERGLKLIYNNDIRSLVSRYYEIVIEMVINDPPDIIGHFDIIKKLNWNHRYFNEEESWYQDTLSDVIKAISVSDCIVEVNTRGYYKGISKEFFPGKQILKKCFEANIPITISSDAHHPNEIGNNIKDAASLLKDIGYRSIYIFDERTWRAIQL
jgi:histidinol-phosphatase (PHP family)